MSKYKKTRKPQAKSLGDVTIDDFANSTAIKHRAKKSSTNVTTVIKQLEQDTSTKAWDDDGLEEYDYVKEENEDGEVTYVLKKIERTLNNLEIDNSSQNSGKDYPLDIWFLISEFVQPEDIGTFARICKTSYSVTYTAKFWFSLYKRYYRRSIKLPSKFQPNYVLRIYGIRTLVIKSLFYLYPPFIKRLKMVKNEEHPDVLTKRMCVSMWHQKMKCQWIYNFKFRDNLPLDKTSNNNIKMNLIDILDDVCANSDEHCRVLQITCLNFILVPPVEGFFMVNAGVTLAQGFRHNRVQLQFNTNPTQGKVMAGTVSILLDPVVNIRVIDWWHPLYPSYNMMDMLLNQEAYST